jgi:nitrogen regulatory protein P-II 1
MKLITAIMRPEKLDELIDTVTGHGAHGMTVTEVRGFGRQHGQLAAVEADLGLAAGRRAALLPKVRLDIVVPDDDAESLVEALAKHARTETIGDGKIWVTTVDSALRVRTGERGREAL